jgi:hypothetical protein
LSQPIKRERQALNFDEFYSAVIYFISHSEFLDGLKNIDAVMCNLIKEILQTWMKRLFQLAQAQNLLHEWPHERFKM